MSMNFSDFRRLLGADPRSRDPAFLRARDSAPEFREAAAEAECFEAKLERALSLPEPPGLIDGLRVAARQGDASGRKRWWPAALAAGMLLAIAAAGLSWRASHRWDSVEEYVVDHYYHDGVKMLAEAGARELAPVQSADLQELFAAFEAQAAPAFMELVGVVRFVSPRTARNPHGAEYRGWAGHRDLHAATGVKTASASIDLPAGVLVQLRHGSAAIVSAGQQDAGALYALVQESILPLPAPADRAAPPTPSVRDQRGVAERGSRAPNLVSCSDDCPTLATRPHPVDLRPRRWSCCAWPGCST
jgi:hypothetical protein